MCFCVVRDALIKKWSIILIQSLIFASLNGCVFSACVALWGEDYYIFMYGVCILCGWQYLYKVTKENRIWLFFLICMTFSFLFFCASVSYLFYAIWMPAASSGLYIYKDVLFFGSPLILFWYPFLLLHAKALSEGQEAVYPTYVEALYSSSDVFFSVMAAKRNSSRRYGWRCCQLYPEGLYRFLFFP